MWSRALTNNLKIEHKRKDEGHSQAQAQAHDQTMKFTFLVQNLSTGNPRDDIIRPKAKCYIISTKTERDIVVVD